MPPGNANCQSIAPANIAAAIGVQYFRQVVITWSIRSRGSVHRTHIMSNTPSVAFRTRLPQPISRTK